MFTRETLRTAQGFSHGTHRRRAVGHVVGLAAWVVRQKKTASPKRIRGQRLDGGQCRAFCPWVGLEISLKASPASFTWMSTVARSPMAQIPTRLPLLSQT